MSEWWDALEWTKASTDLGLWSSIVALIISLYAAAHARRSAVAAENSAMAAAETVSLKREHLRRACLISLEEALPDCDKVTGLISDLPDAFKGDWLALLTSAARQNPRTPPLRFAELLEGHREEWERAALSTSLSISEEAK